MKVAHHPLQSMMTRSQCQNLHNYVTQKKLGKGAYGTVFELCKKADCKFVLKVISYSKVKDEIIGGPNLSLAHHKRLWETEVENHLKLIECQSRYKLNKFIPDVFDAWFCDEPNGDVSFYIVTERFDGDLNHFLKRYDKNKLAPALALAKIQLLYVAMKHVHDVCNFCIDDIKLDNVLYRMSDKEPFVDVDFVFADFGTTITQGVNKEGKDRDDMRLLAVIERFREELRK